MSKAITGEQAERKPTAALVGNGLSIAYNPSLTMPELTARILEDIAGRPGGSDARQTLLALAQNPAAATNFEVLFGPLDDVGDLLTRFAGLSAIIPAQGEAKVHLEQSAAFFRSVRRLGVSHALEHIDDLATARRDQMGTVDQFLGRLISIGTPLTIANLNYDTLVMSSLLQHHRPDLMDMSRGYGRSRFNITTDGRPIVGRSMRDLADLLPGGWGDQHHKRILLLHLHGCLSWLLSADHTRCSFAIDDIRKSGYWAAMRAGTTAWEPDVVLTNQARKTGLVSRPPFAHAYAAFDSGLARAQRWLIAGYSFQDQCVNDLLAAAHRDTSQPLLVITRGPEPDATRVAEALQLATDSSGTPRDLLMCHAGIQEAPATAEWAEWLHRE